MLATEAASPFRFLHKRLWLTTAVFFAGIAYSLSQPRGHYYTLNLYLYCLLLFCFTVHLAFSQKIPVLSPRVLYFFNFLVVIFTAGLAVKPLLMYAPQGTLPLKLLRVDLILATLTALIWAFSVSKKSATFWLTAFLLVVARILVLGASPVPHIDVFQRIQTGAETLLHGNNPYSVAYPEMYDRRYGDFPGFPYLPALLYWVTPFRLLFGDVRAGLLAADVLAAAVIYKITQRQNQLSALPQALALLWLSFPVSLFVLEQSWIDTLLIFLTALLLLSLLDKKWRRVGILLGVLGSVKHYAIFTGIFTLAFAYWESADTKPLRTVILWATMTLGILFAPFLIWNTHDFLQSAFLAYGGLKLRTDSFSIVALLKNHWDLDVPGWLAPLLTLAATGLLLEFFRRRPRPDSWTASLILIYSVVFLFASQAFVNYYQLVASIVLLHLALQPWRNFAHGLNA